MSFQYLKHCRKIICIGRNYAAHIKELNNTVPKQPFFFLKPTSSVITPPTAETSIKKSTFQSFSQDGSRPSSIHIPQNVNVHHEIELALIMKENVSNATKLSKTDLIKSIEGIALAIDLTGRNMQNDVKKAGLPWSMAKGLDTFCPMSEMIPLTQLKDLNPETFQDDFHVSLSVNGETRQDADTSLMLTKMNDMLGHVSQMMSLEQGDVVLTGTPAGVGSLKAGDIVTGQLKYKGKDLIKFEFPCEEKPGSWIYKPS